MASSILETTRNRKEPCLESREVGERLEFHVWSRNVGSNGMSERGRCRGAVANFSQYTCLVFCAELRHGDAGEHLDSLPTSLLSRHGSLRLQVVSKIEDATERNATADRNTIPKGDFQRCFQQWKVRWAKCVQAQGAYFEGDSNEDTCCIAGS